MPSIKFIFNQEVRRVQINHERVGYKDLLLQAKALYPSISEKVSVTFLWSDDEGDMVCCSTDAEVAEALSVMSTLKTMLKFKISVADVEASAEVRGFETDRKIIHDSVTCDGCGLSPIVGFRFKCSVREDFDLCSACESSEIQPHPMIKIYTPDQAPAAIFVCLKEGNAEGRGPNQGRCGRFGPHGGHGHSPHGGHGHGPHRPYHGHGFHPHHNGTHGRPFHSPRAEMMAQRMAWIKEQAKEEVKSVKESFREQKKAFKEIWRQQTQTAIGATPAACSPFIAAADAFVSAFAEGVEVVATKGASGSYFSFDEAAAEAPKPSAAHHDNADESEVEQQLIDEAMRQSIESQIKEAEEAGEAKASPVNIHKASLSPVPVAQAKPVDASFVPSMKVAAVLSGSIPPPPPMPSLSTKAPGLKEDCSAPSAPIAKASQTPQAHFVQDVTFPDGTCIQPGSVMRKTWRVRNVGLSAWPAGCVLACAGGDALCARNLTVPVPTAAVGEEVEITVQLNVPQVTGPHQAFFRLQTQDGASFGQRLWADIRVTEEEADWQVVSGLLIPAKGSGSSVRSDSASSTSEEPVEPAVSSAASAPAMGSAFQACPGVEDLVDADFAALSVPAFPSAIAAAPPAAAPPAVASAEASAAQAWARVWAKELQVLGDMGFTDTLVLLPLLQQHVEVPVSLRPELNGHLAPEGMQRVVAALLSQSGILG